MFSTITIPLSTSRPRARIRAKSTTMFSVTPLSQIQRIPISMESGMAIPTKRALRRPRKNSSTTTTRITPEIILFSKLSTSLRVLSDWSLK